MSIIDFLLKLMEGNPKSLSDDLFRENDSWFEHESVQHEVDDGYCMECDDYEEDILHDSRF